MILNHIYIYIYLYEHIFLYSIFSFVYSFNIGDVDVLLSIQLGKNIMHIPATKTQVNDMITYQVVLADTRVKKAIQDLRMPLIDVYEQGHRLCLHVDVSSELWWITGSIHLRLHGPRGFHGNNIDIFFNCISRNLHGFLESLDYPIRLFFCSINKESHILGNYMIHCLTISPETFPSL